LSPFNVFFCYFTPAVAADRQNLVFVLNVDFDVGVAALSIPRVLARFSHVKDHPLIARFNG